MVHTGRCHTGRCMCGAVTFSAEGDPINVRACHCHQCQAALASPFFARALFDQRNVKVNGPIAAHRTSPALERVFCQECGARLWARRTNGTYMGIALSAFDQKDLFAPTEHIWVSEKVDWLQLNDGLPQHQEKSPTVP